MTTPSHITSRQNPRVKSAVRLRTRRERLRQGRFLVDGAREITRAIATGIACKEAFVRDDVRDSAEVNLLLEALKSSGAEIFLVTREVYEKLAFGDRDEGIVVVAETPRRRLHDIELPFSPLVAVLDGIEKPGNLGAILRSADAAGIDAVVVADAGTDLYNPNTIRASLGTVFRENVCEATAAETIDWLGRRGISIVAATPDADLLYTAANLRDGVAIVLGSEAAGLGNVWYRANVTAVRLPMHGIADSLNVSTTAAVLFYEALRQRHAR